MYGAGGKLIAHTECSFCAEGAAEIGVCRYRKHIYTGNVSHLLNFALAGAREGFGPFLAVYLQARGFDPALTGLAMSFAGVSGLIATTPMARLWIASSRSAWRWR